eukprot:COSAG01_NODE_46050_length_403_cov_3.980263_1_plen_50_part_01
MAPELGTPVHLCILRGCCHARQAREEARLAGRRRFARHARLHREAAYRNS